MRDASIRLLARDAAAIGYSCTTEGCMQGDCPNCQVVARLLGEGRRLALAATEDRAIVAAPPERWRSRRQLGVAVLGLLAECTPQRLAEASGIPVGRLLSGLTGGAKLDPQAASAIADEIHVHADELLQMAVDFRHTFTIAQKAVA